VLTAIPITFRWARLSTASTIPSVLARVSFAVSRDASAAVLAAC